jgi:hypothetical protein
MKSAVTHYQYKIRQISTGSFYKCKSFATAGRPTSKNPRPTNVWSVAWGDYGNSRTYASIADAEKDAAICPDQDDIEIVEYLVSENCAYAPEKPNQI